MECTPAQVALNEFFVLLRNDHKPYRRREADRNGCDKVNERACLDVGHKGRNCKELVKEAARWGRRVIEEHHRGHTLIDQLSMMSRKEKSGVQSPASLSAY